MIDKSTFAERLIELRRSENLTQGKLGELVNVKKQAVNNWEKCLALPSADVLAVLALHFNVSLDWLIGLSTTRARQP